MTDYRITPHAPADLDALVTLVNSAYRGETAKSGWTHEADYMDGQRTSAADLAADLAAETKPEVLVLRREAGGEILACVMIEMLREPAGDVGYIGMLTVKPDLQAGGVGRQLLEAAERHAVSRGATKARMSVISIRDSLIAWYGRRGYALTGATKPFPRDDRFGVPRQDGLDLSFAILEKPLV
jgi:ribosomal protein S18 acetylase RimI-like enzyme